MRVFILVVIIALFFYITPLVQARSGCCSHHGGVCGCGCCDGTGLSATCLPYYPECSRKAPVILIPTSRLQPTSIVWPTAKPRATSTPWPTPTLIPTISSIPSPKFTSTTLPTNEPSPLVDKPNTQTPTDSVLGASTSSIPDMLGGLGTGGVIAGIGFWLLRLIVRKLS